MINQPDPNVWEHYSANAEGMGFDPVEARNLVLAQGPEEMCLSLEHQNPSKTSEKMGYFDCVTVSLHIPFFRPQTMRLRAPEIVYSGFQKIPLG